MPRDLPMASNIDELSERLASEDVELAIIINGVLKERLNVKRLRELLEKLKDLASSPETLLRVKLSGPGGEYKVYAYKGAIVGVVGDTSTGKLYGQKALSVLEDIGDIGIVDVWEIPVDSLPRELQEMLGALTVERARPPPPEGWIGLELGGFRVTGILSDKGAFNYVLRAEAPWGEDVALKIPRLRPGEAGSRLAVYRLVSEGQVLARLSNVERRVLERSLDILGYPRDLARLLEERRQNILRVYAIHAPRSEYRSAEEYLYHPPFLAMELAEGDLEALEAEEPRDYILEAVAKQVGGALALAHALGIGHFDLKPANILYKRVRGALLLKLSDFTGYNRVDGRFIVDLFTPEYSDPLLVASRGLAGSLSSDVFNLAALLYRVARGAPCYCIWILNTLMLSALTGRSPPREALEVLRRRDTAAARYISAVEAAVTLARRGGTGGGGIVENVRQHYEECIEHNTSSLKEPLRTALRTALTLNVRARPRNAVEYYARSLLSL